tara:strand:+ start:9607 stop:10674 length:1068 start_codon:yes stop_codon:yes gene_type:complete
MEHTQAWQRFLKEGGIKSTKTDARLTPNLVIRAIDVYKRVLADFNRWLEREKQPPVRPIRPVGSVTYAQRDLQDGTDVIYGDVDYLVEFPPPPSAGKEYTEARKEENAVKRKYRKLFTSFLNSDMATPEVDIYETMAENSDPFMVILEAHPGLLVQVDTVITFPDYADWLSTRYTPERGLKGYTIGKLYKALGDIFPLTIGTEGVIARKKDGGLVTGKQRKGVELEIISKSPKTFLLDIAAYVLQDKNAEIHPDLQKHGGMTGEISLRKLAQGIRGLALTLEANEYMGASDFLAKVLMNYEEGLEEHRERTTKRIKNKISQLQDASQRDKLEKKIKEIDEINAKALESVTPELRV